VIPRADQAGGTPWRPLLSGEEREEALACVLQVVEALKSEPEVPLPGPAAAMMLLFGYLDSSFPDRGLAGEAGRIWDAAAGGASVTSSSNLHGGVTELAWAAEHLWGDSDGDLCASLDELLEALLARPEEDQPYDLISGLVGFGVYALERRPSTGGRRCLELVEGRLERAAVQTADGVTWFTQRSKRGWISPRSPDAVCDLGVAHGVAGIVGFLARACEGRGGQGQAVLRSATAWILNREIPHTARSIFPGLVAARGGKRYLARTAWCYGDAGMVIPLLLAARVLRAPEWEGRVLDIARRAARRPLEETDVVDATLCHGSAGLAHIYNRLLHHTGDPLFGEAARLWFRRALDAYRSGGVAALTVPRKDPGASRWVGRTLLTGAAGVALALLAASTAVEPGWDRLLLLSSAGTPGGADDGRGVAR
jgi:hypothetical protein